jgi:hypothetical protein
MAQPGQAYSDRLAGGGRRVRCCAARSFPWLAALRSRLAAQLILSRFACLQFDEPQDDLAVALAGPAHGPHAVDHGRLDLDEALAPIALHGPPCCALGQRRGDGLIGHISKGDANHLRALDPGRAVISWRVSVAAVCHRRRRTRAATKNFGVNLGHMWDEIDRMMGWVDQLMRLWEQGAIKPKIARTFPFDEAAAAHHFIQDRKNIGKVVLTPE